MKYNLSTIYWMIQFSSALSSLPAPENVSVISVNFFHKLRWDPSHGTPPGTTYKISCRVNQKETSCPVTPITPNMCILNLKHSMKYYKISVQAVHNFSKSVLSNTSFAPFQDTVISSPTLKLTGCGTCLNLTIQMPEMNLNASATHLFPTFRINWKKREQKQVSEVRSDSANYTINNLERGVEYFVKVYPEAVVNKNLKASEWYTASTSILEASNVPVVLAAWMVLCIVGGILLLVLWGCLFYSGCLCLREKLPGVLMSALVRANILTPEKTIPGLVFCDTPESLPKAKQVKAKPHCLDIYTPTVEEGEEEETDDEDEDVNDCYMDRATEQGLATSFRSDYQNASGADTSLQRDYLSLSCSTISTGMDLEEHVGKSVLEDNSEIIIGDPQLRRGMHGVKREGIGTDGCGNINLFSVTLGAMEQEEEGEQQTAIHILEDPSLPNNLYKTVNLGRRESESDVLMDNQRLLESVETSIPAQIEKCQYACRNSDATNTHCSYLVSHAGNVETEEDEDEDEGLSGYIGR